MGRWQDLQVCLNGHITNDDIESQPGRSVKYCDCGESTIDACQNGQCRQAIHGRWLETGGFYSHLTAPPVRCHDCGTPYSWTQRALTVLTDAMHQDQSLSPQRRRDLSRTVRDIGAGRRVTKGQLAAVKQWVVDHPDRALQVANVVLSVLQVAATLAK